MKFLLLACFLGFAAASFMEHAAPIVDNAVSAMKEGMSKSRSLREALDMPFAYELDVIEYDIKEEIANHLKQFFEKFLEHIKDHINDAKEHIAEWKEKLGRIIEVLKRFNINIGEKIKEIIEKIKDKIPELKDLFKDILNPSGKETRSLQHILDKIQDFKEFVKSLKEKILSNETIQKIRDYVKNIVTENPVILHLKEAFAKLRNVDIKELLKHLFHMDSSRSLRSIREIWERIKDFFKDKHIELKERLARFGEWLKEVWKNGWDKVKDHHQKIKEIAEEFKKHIKEVSKEVALEALEFFRPYQEDLGSLWNQIVELVKGQLDKE